MALYKEVSLTNQGVELLNDLISSNKALEFTNMKATSKKYANSEIREIYVLEDIEQSTSIYKQKRVSGTTTRVESLFSNEELETSYQIQSIGVYAKDVDGKEILFGVSISEDPFFMYSRSEGMPTSANFTLHVGIGEAKLATLERSPSGLATLSDVLKIEEDVITNDQVREANESTRQAEETQRVLSESARVDNEQQREANEQNRITAENERNDLHDLVQQKLENGEFVGEKGDKGETGSVEGLTKAHVETALGYAPADEANLSTDSVTLQGRTPSSFIEVVNHGTTGNYARPAGGISVLWIGTVEPQNALDNDIWIGGSE